MGHGRRRIRRRPAAQPRARHTVQTGRPEDLAALRTARVTGADVTGDSAIVREAQMSGVPEAFHVDFPLARVDGQWYLISAADD